MEISGFNFIRDLAQNGDTMTMPSRQILGMYESGPAKNATAYGDDLSVGPSVAVHRTDVAPLLVLHILHTCSIIPTTASSHHSHQQTFSCVAGDMSLYSCKETV